MGRGGKGWLQISSLANKLREGIWWSMSSLQGNNTIGNEPGDCCFKCANQCVRVDARLQQAPIIAAKGEFKPGA